MKTFILFVFVATALLAGCKKEKALPQSLIGKWEERHVSGGQAQVPNTSPNTKAGNGYIIEFSETGFQRSQNGEITSQGTYKLMKDSVNIDGTIYNDALLFNNESLKRYVKVSGNKLMISIGSIAFDGMTVTYQRLR